MKDSTLKTLLKEYEQKRLSAALIADDRKQAIYSSNSRLEQIDSELNHFAIQTAKSILSDGKDTFAIKDLEEKIAQLKQEKNAILHTLQIDTSYFEPTYRCEFCHDTGYIQENAYTSTLCRCIKQKLFDVEYNKSNVGNIAKDNFDHFDPTLYSELTNEELYRATVSPRANIQNIKEIALSFVKNFESSDEKNLLFTGNTGLGKTFLSNCIANELLQQGKTVLYQTAPVLLDSIIDYRFGKGSLSKELYDSILEVDLLIIDDLGTECMNSMKFAELFNIINTRLLNQNSHIAKTIISTNLSLQNLSSTYDERIFSRFVGYYNICRFFGEDIRFKK